MSVIFFLGSGKANRSAAVRLICRVSSRPALPMDRGSITLTCCFSTIYCRESIAKPVSGCKYVLSTNERLGTELLSPPFLKGDLGQFLMGLGPPVKYEKLGGLSRLMVGGAGILL